MNATKTNRKKYYFFVFRNVALEVHTQALLELLHSRLLIYSNILAS